ncbi:TPA: hypothetical protein N0F65_009130, partial [Lagenidium giganteum]
MDGKAMSFVLDSECAGGTTRIIVTWGCNRTRILSSSRWKVLHHVKEWGGERDGQDGQEPVEQVSQLQPMALYTPRFNVGTIDRLGLTCMLYRKMVVDKGMVDGMMYSNRKYYSCHLGKQRQSRRCRSKGNLLTVTTAPNEVLLIDLMFPSTHNGTRYTAMLVLMDALSRFIKVLLLKTKAASVVNRCGENKYCGPNDKPVGRSSGSSLGVFSDVEMKRWYATRGIERIKVGPKSSHLNPVEREHQTIANMSKLLVRASGLSKLLWPEALQYAVFIKNRNKFPVGTPYQTMCGIKPDLCRIRKFGALAFVHVPKDPATQRENANVKIGWILVLDDENVGYKIYYTDERTRKWAADVRVEESIVFKDRHDLLDEDVKK